MVARRIWILGLVITGSLAGSCQSAQMGAVHERATLAGRCERASWLDRREGDVVVLLDLHGREGALPRGGLPSSIREGQALLAGRVDPPCTTWLRSEVARIRAGIVEVSHRGPAGSM